MRLPPALLTPAMQKMRDPVVELAQAIYGEKNAGDFWGDHFKAALKSKGFRVLDRSGGETAFAHLYLRLFSDF